MSDKMRWRYGDTNPVVAAVQAATVIEIGDLLWQDVNHARPAADQPDTGTEAGNQDTFALQFLGVAMQRSRAGDAAPIRVATTGVFEFDCPAATFELGDLIAPDGNSAGTGLCNQQVVEVQIATRAIARVAKREASASSTVLIDVRSTVMTGGIVDGSHSGV